MASFAAFVQTSARKKDLLRTNAPEKTADCENWLLEQFAAATAKIRQRQCPLDTAPNRRNDTRSSHIRAENFPCLAQPGTGPPAPPSRLRPSTGMTAEKKKFAAHGKNKGFNREAFSCAKVKPISIVDADCFYSPKPINASFATTAIRPEQRRFWI
jgi:hypothetical protein